MIVAAANLPCQAPFASNLRDVFISARWITRSIEAENGRDRRRDCNLYRFTKTAHKQIAGRVASIGTIRQKAANRSVNLMETFGQSSWVAHVVFCQIRANDISSCDLQSKVQLAPRLTFGLCFMFALQPLPFTRYFQARNICSIPDDRIAPRRSAFFMARSGLRDIRDGVRPC